MTTVRDNTVNADRKLSRRIVQQKAAVISLGLLLAVSTGCQRSNSPVGPEMAKQGWESLGQGESGPEDWTLYARDKKGSKFREYRVAGTIDAPPNRSAQAVRTTILDKRYFDADENRTIISQSADAVVMYSLMRMPFPFRDRDLTVVYEFKSEDNGVYSVTWRDAHSQGPEEVKGVIRIPMVSGGWTFVPSGDGQSAATSVGHFDIGGRGPGWMTRSMAAKTMVGSLDTLRTIVDDLE